MLHHFHREILRHNIPYAAGLAPLVSLNLCDRGRLLLCGLLYSSGNLCFMPKGILVKLTVVPFVT